MRKDQVLNGYRVVTKPSNADAGKCLWAFAERDGQEFFIKEFLDPKWPRPDAMGSAADKRRRLEECRRFEERHRRIAGQLRADHRSAGNLVLTKDFFVDGTRFYKVTERIRPAEVRPCDLDHGRRVLLLRTLVASVQLLHEVGVVHGDLKPENVLLHRPPGSDLHIAKLIDFDDAYVAGQPPPRDQIGGNSLYGAPEWLRYLNGDATVQKGHLAAAVDMFAFGLLAHFYLCGELPNFPAEYQFPAAAAVAGVRLTASPRVERRLRPLIDALLAADPKGRPSAADAADALAGLNSPIAVPRASRVRSTFTRR